MGGGVIGDTKSHRGCLGFGYVVLKKKPTERRRHEIQKLINSLFDVFQKANCSGRDFFKALIREAVQQVMEAEIAHALGAAPFERTGMRRVASATG